MSFGPPVYPALEGGYSVTATRWDGSRVYREFGSLVAARTWEIAMTMTGYATGEPVPLGRRPHLSLVPEAAPVVRAVPVAPPVWATADEADDDA